jgi:hypothetical protein
LSGAPHTAQDCRLAERTQLTKAVANLIEHFHDDYRARWAGVDRLYEWCDWRTIGCLHRFSDRNGTRPWNVWRAGLYGAGIGLVAALVKIFGPFQAAEQALPFALEACVAVAAFALLCVGAALLRNLLALRL